MNPAPEEALLVAHEHQPGFLPDETEFTEATIKLDLDEPPSDEAVGQTLGRYKPHQRGCSTDTGRP